MVESATHLMKAQVTFDAVCREEHLSLARKNHQEPVQRLKYTNLNKEKSSR